MTGQSELFEIQHGGRRLTVARRGRGHWKTYIGAINGDVCAVGPAKGDLLRRLVEMARHYPKDPTLPIVHPRRKRGVRPERR